MHQELDDEPAAEADPDLEKADALPAMLSPRKLVVRGAHVMQKAHLSPVPVSWPMQNNMEVESPAPAASHPYAKQALPK